MSALYRALQHCQLATTAKGFTEIGCTMLMAQFGKNYVAAPRGRTRERPYFVSNYTFVNKFQSAETNSL